MIKFTSTVMLALLAFGGNALAQNPSVNLEAIRFIESSNNPHALNRRDHDGKGSRGLYQISEGLRLDYNRLNKTSVSSNDLFNPKTNEKIAVWAFTYYYPLLLRKVLKKPITTENLIVCHNAGCGALRKPFLNKTTINYLKKYKQFGDRTEVSPSVITANRLKTA